MQELFKSQNESGVFETKFLIDSKKPANLDNVTNVIVLSLNGGDLGEYLELQTLSKSLQKEIIYGTDFVRTHQDIFNWLNLYFKLFFGWWI